MNTTTSSLLAQDRAHCWHPFTAHDAWMDSAGEQVVIAEAEGCVLVDTEGRSYLDGNASIWTNLHGHRHPALDEAVRRQLGRIAHSSFLGLTNAVAPPLAARLSARASGAGEEHAALARVFFSDDGSTAMEAALKIVYQFYQQNGEPRRTRILSLGGAYHGDTVGAMSVGHSPVFHHTYRGLLFPAEEVMAPACYRCPYNRAQPQKNDARVTRQCQWECVDEVERAVAREPETLAAWVQEPRVQGAAGMLMHPPGYLARVAAIVHGAGARVILDEVLTGFGRTGAWFAFQHEEEAGARPDAVALAKGLTSGYLPFAATLTTEALFDGFRGDLAKTFYHGHSYTGNQLGATVATANLDLLEAPGFWETLRAKQACLARAAEAFWEHPHVGDVRQEGMILAVELVADFATRAPFPRELRLGAKVCERARQHGLLTRPIGDVLVLMPPYCATQAQIEEMVHALLRSVSECCPP